MNQAGYHYRITIDLLEAPHPQPGEDGGLQSLSFFACTSHDILTAGETLRARLHCSACEATKLAIGLGLIGEAMHSGREPKLFNEPMREVLGSLDPDGPKANL